MPNHPNRGRNSSARNPKPDEIRAARDRVGLTEAEAAEIIYCTQAAWIRWESGERKMHPAMWELWRWKIDREIASGTLYEDK